MSKYSFTVRKHDCEISLTTDDRNAIEQQIAIWVLALSRKPILETPVPEIKPFIPEEIKEEESVQEEFIESAPIITTKENSIIEEGHNEESDSIEPDEEIIPEIPVEESSIKPFEPEIIKNEVSETQTYVEEFINTMEPPVNIEQPKETLNTILANEETSLKTPEIEPLSKDVSITLNSLFNAESPTTSDFDSILEKSVESITPETSNVVKKDEIFCKLVKANNITDRLELLLFTADYFCKYDARFAFSLKQINGKLMNNLAVIVDHGILKIALDNNYLERVGESEYKLTEYGRSEIYSKAGIWS